MKKCTQVILLFTTLMLSIASFNAQARLNVFACEPEWKSLVEELAGEKVKAFSATSAFQDPHHIEARPSLIAKTRKADLVVCTGLELEIGWLPLLLSQSGNKKVKQNAPGNFIAGEQVSRLDVLTKVDRSMGDVHAQGNPHVHLDPNRMLIIANALTARLITIDSSNKAYYEKRNKSFVERWTASIKKWETLGAALKGKKVIVNHQNWRYLTNWLGINVVGDLEPKPGVPPTSAHLATLIEMSRIEKPDVILMAAYQDKKGAKWLSKKTNIPIAQLPFTIGGNDDASDLFSLYENTITLLLQKVK